MGMKPLEKLQKGDWIKIEFGYDIHWARVLNNSPEDKKLYLSVKEFWKFFTITRKIFDYTGYNFKNYKLLN